MVKQYNVLMGLKVVVKTNGRIGDYQKERVDCKCRNDLKNTPHGGMDNEKAE